MTTSCASKAFFTNFATLNNNQIYGKQIHFNNIICNNYIIYNGLWWQFEQHDQGYE